MRYEDYEDYEDLDDSGMMGLAIVESAIICCSLCMEEQKIALQCTFC